MKISIETVNGEKQVTMTPETDHEKQALKIIIPVDSSNNLVKQNSYIRFLRPIMEEDLVFILKQKNKELK